MIARKAKIPAAMTAPAPETRKRQESKSKIHRSPTPFSRRFDQRLIQVFPRTGASPPRSGSRIHRDLPGCKMIEKQHDPHCKSYGVRCLEDRRPVRPCPNDHLVELREYIRHIGVIVEGHDRKCCPEKPPQRQVPSSSTPRGGFSSFSPGM